MELLGAIFFALLGVIIGSFLNVVILRFNTGKGSGGRSMCLSCTKQLTWTELLPVVSFFALGRRCRECKSKLSWQYPLVELTTAALFLVIFYIQLPLLYAGSILFFCVTTGLLLVIWSMFVVVFVYDLYHKIIPNQLAYSLAVFAFVYRMILIPYETWMTTPVLLDICAGFIFFIPFWFLWRISHGAWIGLGDGKLALSIGWLLGFVTGASAIILAFWIGAVVGIGLLLISKLNKSFANITMKAEIPFAPFLIIGTLLGFIAPMDFFGFDLLFSLF